MMTEYIDTFELDEKQLDFMTNYFERKIYKDKSDKKDVTQIQKIFRRKDKNLLTDDDIYIRDLANTLLEKIGLHQNINYFMIELWRYRAFNDDLKPDLPKHRDSNGIIKGSVNTCIFYIRKDSTIRGGNLQFYGKDLFDSFRSVPIHVVNSSNNTTVCMDGDLVHSITSFNGFGIRDCIVVQFEKKPKKTISLFNYDITFGYV